jgi:general secretion pathway protein A
MKENAMDGDPLEELIPDDENHYGGVEDHKPGHPNPLMELIDAPMDPFPTEDESPVVTASESFLEFYQLHENPFNDSVNPEYFYQTDNHHDSFQRMLMAVEHDVSLAMTTGLSGTGKTLITQLLLQHLDQDRFCPVVVLVSPAMSRTGLLREIIAELNIALPAGMIHTHGLLKILGNAVIDLFDAGRKLVLIFDECHFLTSENLHIIRTISNIEIPERKLTTSLLFGEARFAQRLRHSSYDSLRNRMYMKAELLPMSEKDCSQYIKFRCMVAGRTTDLFDDDALEAVHRTSGGICRNVNKLCMLALMEGFLRRSVVIDAPLIERCAALL